jgi:hypothetical protein
MEDEAWESITVVENKQGVPHVLQQKVEVYTSGPRAESSGYTKPTTKHRLVAVKDLVEM